MSEDLTPEKLLAAYASGIFPMADEEGELFWLAPDPRAIIELDSFKVSRSLRSVWRREVFDITVNRAFPAVLEHCADRPEGTWISDEIIGAYTALFHLGYAYSVESWKDDRLAGGLYGVAIRGAFFGESMFHNVDDASKVALVYLIERMGRQGMVLLDVQFITEHLRKFGAIEIKREQYNRRLGEALTLACSFGDDPPDPDPASRVRPGKREDHG